MENEPGKAHIRWMEKYRSSMLEVSVTRYPPQWEWQVTINGEMIANGFEREQTAAKFEGYTAMFLLLAAGWNPSFASDLSTPAIAKTRIGKSGS
jgi:hypothetical protein